MKILKEESVLPVIKDIISSSAKVEETISLQISLKGYDSPKDPRFNKEVALPHPKRSHEKVLIIANQAMIPFCQENNLEYVDVNDYVAKTPERAKIMGRIKKKLVSRYDSFISFVGHAKLFEIRFFANKKKQIVTVKTADEIPAKIEHLKHSVVMKKKPNSQNIHFPTGCCANNPEEIYENVIAGLGGLVEVLKKGESNIDTIYIKRCQGAAVRLF